MKLRPLKSYNETEVTRFLPFLSDMQWKVRRTLASSIHELGAILGEQASAEDLIPVFNGFLKDLDEVRIGVLKHLSDFLGLLDVDSRREYLPKLPDFLKMDNERNWRFRLELTEQLEKLLPLYSPADVDEHISPMVMVLIRDKVAAVRECATEVLTSILRTLNASTNPELAQNLVRIVVEAQVGVFRSQSGPLCKVFIPLKMDTVLI